MTRLGYVLQAAVFALLVAVPPTLVASCKPGEAKVVETDAITGAQLACVLAAPLEATDAEVAALCGIVEKLRPDLARGRAAARARLAPPVGSR